MEEATAYAKERAAFSVTGSGLMLVKIAPEMDTDSDILAQMKFCPKSAIIRARWIAF